RPDRHPPVGGGGHLLGHHQAGAGGRGGVEGGGVGLAGQPVHRLVERPRRHHHPVGQGATGRQRQRREQRGGDDEAAGTGGGEAAVDAVDQHRVAGGVVQVADAPAAGQQVEGERLGGEAEVAADGFEVPGGVGGHLLEPLHDGLAV